MILEFIVVTNKKIVSCFTINRLIHSMKTDENPDKII